MQLPDYFKFPLAQNLAYRIVQNLDGFASIVEDRSTYSIQVTGKLPIGDEHFRTNALAQCRFDVDPFWIWKIPTVYCFESWVLRKIPDWHVYEDGRLCFEFDLHWNQGLTLMVDKFTHGLTAEYACVWLLSSTRSLLRRHLFASRTNIESWPPEWNFWAHGVEAAKAELERIQRKQARAAEASHSLSPMATKT